MHSVCYSICCLYTWDKNKYSVKGIIYKATHNLFVLKLCLRHFKRMKSELILTPCNHFIQLGLSCSHFIEFCFVCKRIFLHFIDVLSRFCAVRYYFSTSKCWHRSFGHLHMPPMSINGYISWCNIDNIYIFNQT